MGFFLYEDKMKPKEGGERGPFFLSQLSDHDQNICADLACPGPGQ